jgi:hypothetical protein
MSKLLQRVLLAVGVVAFLVLLVEIGLSIAATLPGSTPARVVQVKAGPYPLTVSLYKDSANAGYALPFTISSPQAKSLTFDASTVPAEGVDATPVHASLTATPNGAQGTAEITVQGAWTLQVDVNGSAGPGTALVPINATAPPAIPLWLGWLIGLIPLYGLLLFLLLQRNRKAAQTVTVVAGDAPAHNDFSILKRIEKG